MKNRTASQFSRGAAGPLMPSDTVHSWPQPPDWTELAECQYTDPETFFPEKGGSSRPAKKVCRSCEVRLECLAYAMDSHDNFGVWGGFSEFDRRRIRQRGLTPAEALGVESAAEAAASARRERRLAAENEQRLARERRRRSELSDRIEAEGAAA